MTEYLENPDEIAKKIDPMDDTEDESEQAVEQRQTARIWKPVYDRAAKIAIDAGYQRIQSVKPANRKLAHGEIVIQCTSLYRILEVLGKLNNFTNEELIKISSFPSRTGYKIGFWWIVPPKYQTLYAIEHSALFIVNEQD